MNHRLLLTLALCGAVLPLTIVGCGGGNGGLLNPNPTARPNPTATPTANQPVALPVQAFTLGNGQRVTLNLTQTGAALKGTAQIAAATAQKRVLATGAQALLSVQIPPGLLPIEGTFTAPRGFDLRATDGSFSVKGNLATPTQAGTYNLTLANGQTDSGIVPATGTPTGTATPTPTTATPTATPLPTTPPTSGPLNVTASPVLIFSDFSANSNLLNRSSLASFDKFSTADNEIFNYTGTATYQSAKLQGTLQGNGTAGQRTIAIAFSGVANIQSAGANFKVGDVRQFNVFNQIIYSEGVDRNNNIYKASSGTMTITKLGANSLSIAVDALMVPYLGDGVGSFRIKGTVNGTGLKVTNFTN